jgi:hypothetical protein
MGFAKTVATVGNSLELFAAKELASKNVSKYQSLISERYLKTR